MVAPSTQQEQGMSLPHESVVQSSLMALIDKQPGRVVEPPDAYRLLEPEFACLTTDETRYAYQHSVSKFANHVQRAVQHLKNEGWLLETVQSGRGRWEFSARARAEWRQAFPDGKELFAEMMQVNP
jgi:hypothetical protein